MKKFLKLAAAMLITVAIVCTTGCKKSSDNNDNNNSGGGTVTPTCPTGAIDGLFSVSANKQVYFSQGNLQYQASTNTWRFAENQWNFVGGTEDGNSFGNVYENDVKCDNTLISSTYDGWIDLYGWGTSAWNDGYTNCYQPYSTSENYMDYYYSWNNVNSNADWGYYNPISNGGNTPRLWRTLLQDEWDYLINERTTTSNIRYAYAIVNGVRGVILVPDNWNSDYHHLNNTNELADYSVNVIDNNGWINKLERNGAVFLPAAGVRLGNSLNSGDDEGYYWTLSQHSHAFRYSFDFYSSHWFETEYNYCFLGMSVRLVQDYQ